MGTRTMIQEFNSYLNARISGNIYRYGVLFTTHHKYYFYDTGTNKILECTETVYCVLMNLFKNDGMLLLEDNKFEMDEIIVAIQEIKLAIEKEHIFSRPKLEKFNTGYIEECCKTPCCSQLILEVTEKCNFRCRYCIYKEDNNLFRNFENKEMTFEVAKKAMDFVLKISNQTKMALTFYGGEPLLNYELIKQCMEYFKIHYTGQRLAFNLTSNLTLLTSDMAKYFNSNDVYITCSLDGNESLHNQNRVYVDGRGTYKDTVKGLKILLDAYGDKYTDFISINMVIDKPYCVDKYELIQDFVVANYWLNGIDISVSYADYSSDYIPVRINVMDEDIEKQYSDEIGNWTFDKLLAGNVNVFSKKYILDRLRKVHKRRIKNEPYIHTGLNGCCIPGERRLYVDTMGDFMLCEKIGKSPFIGNINTGFDMDKIRKYYVDDYCEKSLNECAECWAINLCGVCYASMFEKGEMSMIEKMKKCNAQKYLWYKTFIQYHTFMEECPEVLKLLNES